MCYVLLLSTTSVEDLSQQNTELVRFTTELPAIAEVAVLQHANRWYVGSKTGCSCTFRHLYSVELGFGEPVDWFEEDPEGIEATLSLIALIRRLVGRGEEVDCVDAWEHQAMHAVAGAVLDVDLSAVSDRQFRFFENHHFRFRSQPGNG
jgi:hypothetical protein